jgi:hypothetical protein
VREQLAHETPQPCLPSKLSAAPPAPPEKRPRLDR